MINPLKKSSSLPPRPAGFKLCLLLLVLWAAGILTLSLMPNPPQLPGIFGWDKLLHACAYALLTLLVALVLLRWPARIKRPWLTAWILTVAYGALLEVLQVSLQTGRFAEWGDLFADALGALIACVVFRHIKQSSLLHRNRGDRHRG